MHALGERWHHRGDGVFVEHRGTDLCLQALAQLRNTFEPPAGAPVALGGTPEDDPYLLPSFMAATVVGAAGLRAVNLGPHTPVSALRHAADHHAPSLVWISASAPLPRARARQLAGWLASLRPVTAVVGGRASAAITAVDPSIRRAETMGELARIAEGLARAAPALESA